MWAWVLLLAILALAVLGIARLVRRTHDEAVDTMRSLGACRRRLTTDASALRSDSTALGERLDRGPGSARR